VKAFKKGDIVDYHSVIGGPITGYRFKVLSLIEVSGGTIVWLEGVRGPIPAEALTLSNYKAPKIMKAISLKQPWASLVASGQKTIETRTWCTSYRGPILICASKKPTGFGPVGVALCIAEITDCVKMTKEHEQAACCEVYPDAKAWILDNIRPIKPFPVKGQLNIFEVEVPDELHD